jgi:hypothetical protein
MEVGLQLVIDVAFVPLNVTVPCVEPKFCPVIVTEAPTGAADGDINARWTVRMRPFPESAI